MLQNDLSGTEANLVESANAVHLGQQVQVKSSPVTRLEKQKFDFASTRIQMLLGLLVVLVVCIYSYQPVLKIGFLLDDFLHVDYVARAFAGDQHDFLANFTSNWAGSDLMKSYRPLVSMTFWTDYLFWHARAYDFHLTNILLLAACCMAVALITIELTGRAGNRMLAAPAVWAALLFAVYPLHPEATAWIVGRVDLLCTLFYLLSLFCFLRFQQIRETQYLVFSLVTFALSVLSKEMAVTLPLVVTVAAVLLRPEDPPRPGEERKRYMLKLVAQQTWMYWAVLAALAAMRMQFLGTLIGGYGQSDIGSLVASLYSFFDRASLFKIFVPVSEELHPSRLLIQGCAALIAAAVALGVFKNIICRSSWKPALFLIFWAAIALVPTFQIWHIYPNLVGSRLFFLSSAPFCMLLALLATPATEHVSKGIATILAGTGAAILAAIFLVWSHSLELNLVPWVEAGKRMSAIDAQLDELTNKAHGKSISLMTLPTDYKGAGMITRPSYLAMMTKPPFHQSDISRLIVSTEGNGADHNLAQRLRRLTENQSRYIWSDSDGKFVPWTTSKGLSSLAQNFDRANKTAIQILPGQVVHSTSDAWQVRTGIEPYVEQYADFIRVYPGIRASAKDQGLALMPQTAVRLNPLEAEDVLVKCRMHDKDSQQMTDEPNKPPRLFVCWKQELEGKKGLQEFERPLRYLSTDLYISTVGESTDWCQARDIVDLGIKCSPGNYVVDIYWMKAGNSPTITNRTAPPTK